MSRDWNRSSVDWSQVNQPAPRTRPKIKRIGARPYQASYYRSRAGVCVSYLQAALTAAQEAGAPYTIARIRLALSSARGAVRNAGYRETRAHQKEISR
jgi:hypothetical protein